MRGLTPKNRMRMSQTTRRKKQAKPPPIRRRHHGELRLRDQRATFWYAKGRPWLLRLKASYTVRAGLKTADGGGIVVEVAMASVRQMTMTFSVVAFMVTAVACDKPAETEAAPVASSAPAAAPSAPPVQPSAVPKPKAPVKKPSHACPTGSSGEGTRDKPCMAKGKARAMVAQWTGKIRDKGPSFRVTNKTKLEILYGNIYVYFYDKAGKQITIGEGDKARGYRACSGNIFAGPMKAGERATLYFSCVKKKHVPEGTASIEAELKTVGFTAKSGKTSDTFWRNNDLVPPKRPKGGIK